MPQLLRGSQQSQLIASFQDLIAGSCRIIKRSELTGVSASVQELAKEVQCFTDCILNPEVCRDTFACFSAHFLA